MALLPTADLERAIRSRIARVVVGPSTVRGNPTGTTEAARRFLRALPLQRFGTGDGAEFSRALDRATIRLQAALPRAARRWGVARKLLNIYLRDCVYSAHLRSVYALGRMERFCELPLDSITATRLRGSEEGAELPAWPGVGAVTPQVSAEYQQVAAKIGRALRMRRVHLDVFWWSEERDG